MEPKNIRSAITAACTLHNFMRVRYPKETQALVDREDPHTHHIINGAWRDRECLTAMQAIRGNNATQAAKGVRNYLCRYYNTRGAVYWQERMI